MYTLYLVNYTKYSVLRTRVEKMQAACPHQTCKSGLHPLHRNVKTTNNPLKSTQKTPWQTATQKDNAGTGIEH
jgi:hypothetical protein